MKKSKLVIAGLLAVAVASTSGITSNLFGSSALSSNDLKSLTTLEKAHEVTDTTVIPKNYSFTPSIQYDENGKQITEAYTFGPWDYQDIESVVGTDDNGILQSTNGSSVVWIDKGDHSYDGRLGVYYNNVGTYNGKTVALRVTYMGDADDSTDNGFGLIMYKDRIGIRTSLSPNQVTFNYEFIDAETDEPLDVQGYQQIEDIDVYQGVNVDNYDAIYYDKDALDTLKVVDYADLEGTIQSTLEDDIQDDSDNRAKFVYTFTGSKVNITWTSSKCYYKNIENQDIKVAKAYKDLDKQASITRLLNAYYYVDADGNVVNDMTDGATKKAAVLTLDLSSKSFVSVEKQDPAPNPNPTPDSEYPILKVTKTVGSKAYKPGDTATYKVFVTQTVKDKTARQVEILDGLTCDLADGLEAEYVIDSLVVKDQNGKQLTDGEFGVIAKDSTLKVTTNVELAYNDVMEFDYNVKINDTAKMKKLTNSVNASSVSNPYDVPTATVDTTITQSTVEDKDPQLSVVKTADKEKYLVGEKATYTIKATQLSAGKVAEDIVIKDDLKPDKAELDPSSIQVFDKDGNVINDVSVTVKDNDFIVDTKRDLNGNESVSVTYQVKFTDKSLTNTTVENDATATSTTEGIKEATAVSNVKVVDKLTSDATNNQSNNQNGQNTNGNQKVETQTGDRTPIMMFAIIAVLSVLGIGTTLVIKKRK